MKIDSSIITASKELIEKSRKIIITNHTNPDGDAMGSALGLKNILEKAEKQATVIVPNDYPDFLKWMKGSEEVLIYEKNQDQANTLIEEADLIFHLDYNALKRGGNMQQVLTKAKAKRIVIDHHQQPEDFAQVLFSDVEMSSTCEMVFHFVKELGWEENIDKAAAECLYSGIMTDTGNFRFSSTHPLTHRVAARLLEIGVQPNAIASRIYDTNTRDRLALLGCALEKMEVLSDLHTAILHLSADDLQRYNYRKGDTEGFVNYGLSLEGVVLSIFISEKNDVVKMSFRSKGDFDVNLLAREYFNGGGHLNAAGAVSDLSLKETIEKLKDVLSQYENRLQNTN